MHSSVKMNALVLRQHRANSACTVRYERMDPSWTSRKLQRKEQSRQSKAKATIIDYDFPHSSIIALREDNDRTQFSTWFAWCKAGAVTTFVVVFGMHGKKRDEIRLPKTHPIAANTISVLKRLPSVSPRPTRPSLPMFRAVPFVARCSNYPTQIRFEYRPVALHGVHQNQKRKYASLSNRTVRSSVVRFGTILISLKQL